MHAWLDDLVDSDMPTVHDRERYLGFARNVRAGHHSELGITGNAFHVRFTRAGVCVESLWDESRVPQWVALEAFIEALHAYPYQSTG